jgi:hypothetical protein
MIRAGAGWSNTEMPLARYFLFVGGALLALLFVFNAYAPPLAVVNRTEAANDLPVIRINSERKWPERIEFDTSMTPIIPAQLVKAEKAETVPAPATIAAVSAGERVRDAFGQFTPADSRKPDLKLPPKHKVAKSRVNSPTVVAAQQPRFGFLAN